MFVCRWGVSDADLCFDPSSRFILFTSNRCAGDGDCSRQIWITSVRTVDLFARCTSSAHKILRHQCICTSPQVDGETLRRVSSYPTAVSSLLMSPNWKVMAFASDVSARYRIRARHHMCRGTLCPCSRGKLTFIFCSFIKVYPNMTMEETVRQDRRRDEEGANYLVFDKLFVRHWDEVETS